MPKRKRSITREEEQRRLEACTGNRVQLKTIILCAIDAGMRRGEILSLKWEDVDFEHFGSVNVRRWFTAVRAAAGVPAMHFYDLRRTRC